MICQLATVDNTFGGNLNPTKLYIIRNTDDKAGNPSGQQSDSTLISQTIQGKITGLLRDLPTEIVWIDEFQNAELIYPLYSLPKTSGHIPPYLSVGFLVLVYNQEEI